MSFKKVPPSVREVVAARANYLCEYCRCPEAFSTQSFTIEHIKPRQAGGENTLENLAWACSGCNAFKHIKTRGIDPQTEQEVTLFHPRQDRWQDHFTWSDDLTRVVGKTPCGRATLNTLNLNRQGIVNLRRLLVMDNRHPPVD
ncbi:MAG: HNH endonuclease signature motif containing protein [Jaaginema sp. PMC 1079.18]|nr:HNH endonuclease signature motif containing protein [Jaaginema sp. PMC 1080.18]MEC4853920.1 HNH endonuclease signature motif containing protein [Jaaginema sp. PMC 1079.18]MEC4866129.1 HNH endonuclease signature motif containing protein [Jaaginema sp. PMC 1078.18]